MTDWVFYSSKCGFASAGDLLRSIPSARIWRLERNIDDDGTASSEMVRAAEQLLDLDASLRLQNDPSAAISLRVVEANDRYRRQFAELGRTEFPPDQLQIVAEIGLKPSAIEAGHLDIGDDVLVGLEQLYRGGIAHCTRSGELVAVSELSKILNSDVVRCSHLDLQLSCDRRQRDYVSRQLAELPPPFGQYMRIDGETLFLRTRFPTTLSAEEVNAVCSLARDMARYAKSGHVRFRERGVWTHAVTGIGTQVAEPPDGADGVFSRLTRLFRPNK